MIVPCKGFVLIASSPDRIAVFTFDERGICVGVSTGTTTDYIGQDLTDIQLAMWSVLRYEDGTEKQPNTGHSANGYPQTVIFQPVYRMPEAQEAEETQP